MNSGNEIPAHAVGLAANYGGRSMWRWRPIEVVVAGCIVVVMLGIALPTIQHQREMSRRMACQNNLRELRTSLASYSGTNGDQLLVPRNLVQHRSPVPMLHSFARLGC